jgi:hypothetical protein
VQLNPVGGFHVYVVAPLAFNIVESPKQIVGEGEAVAVTDNEAATVIVTLSLLLHPFALVPVT